MITLKGKSGRRMGTLDLIDNSFNNGEARVVGDIFILNIEGTILTLSMADIVLLMRHGSRHPNNPF